MPLKPLVIQFLSTPAPQKNNNPSFQHNSRGRVCHHCIAHAPCTAMAAEEQTSSE